MHRLYVPKECVPLWQRYVKGYLIAVSTTIAAIWVRSLLQPAVNSECPFSLFFLSVLITAWLAGTGPALVAWVFGALAASHFFIAPKSSLLIEDTADLVSLCIYAIVNLVAILLFHLHETGRALAEKRMQEIDLLNRSLRRSDQRKDEFLALLAHELRNPLAPIQSSLTLLQRSPTSQSVNDIQAILTRQVGQLVRIVDDLFDISRFMRGKLSLNCEVIDLREPVHLAVEMTHHAFQAKSQTFRLLLPREPVLIQGDSVRLAQMLANILGNAAKYTPKDGRITLELEVEAEQAKLVISDTGIGFPIDQRERILEPFCQMDTSRTRDYGGLGLGLAIAKNLVELHGGYLLPFSRGPGTGSRFTVMLPRTSQSLAAEHQGPETPVTSQLPTTESSPLPAVSTTSSTTRILVVDDNVDACLSLVTLLKMEDYEVASAHDGISGLELAEGFLPTVVLLDLGLPGVDGYEVARRLRTRRQLSDVKIIALTGWGSEQDRLLTTQFGFDDHLVKPVLFEDLLSRLPPTASSVGCATAAT